MITPISKLISIFFILVIFSCGKDAMLQLARTDYSGNDLKLDGYFLGNGNDDGVTNAYFFYRNGVILYGGGFPNDMNIEEVEETWRSDSFDQLIKDQKTGWGVFSISNTDIQFETWEAGNGRLKTAVRSGEILNDQTFVITRLLNNYTNNTVALKDTFRFQSFSPKPDSTNLFIQ